MEKLMSAREWKERAQAQLDDVAEEMRNLAEYIVWLERGLQFIADGKAERPADLARQVLNRHVWAAEWAKSAEHAGAMGGERGMEK
jgi:hypothetical protein